ncbi:hypothetical protein Y032_0003g1363 [Ancylostoma ceylanicum]|uniref:Uncharacterized protein n=1 Tax=Ancylostoma ceylanicum TaxID=53326 RepID=A0A016VWV4_9BILA|nr:hypothetical protein Y032_0003g1363 [Ancylostoma ceylanicum]
MSWCLLCFRWFIFTTRIKNEKDRFSPNLERKYLLVPSKNMKLIRNNRNFITVQSILGAFALLNKNK